MRKAVFIDKDGTLIPDIPYNTDPDLIRLEDNSIEGLRKLQQQSYLLIIVSNQVGVAHGFFEEEKLTAVKKKIIDLLDSENIYLHAFYYCPHHPAGKTQKYNIDCDCRKPKPGMLLKAAKDFDIDLSRSWMIGDILNDVEAGRRAGCNAILIDNNNETEWHLNEFRKPDYMAKTINQAAEYILKL
jgi:histidinol-phosphate phosphatase family protein